MKVGKSESKYKFVPWELSGGNEYFIHEFMEQHILLFASNLHFSVCRWASLYFYKSTDFLKNGDKRYINISNKCTIKTTQKHMMLNYFYSFSLEYEMTKHFFHFFSSHHMMCKPDAKNCQCGLDDASKSYFKWNYNVFWSFRIGKWKTICICMSIFQNHECS